MNKLENRFRFKWYTMTCINSHLQNKIIKQLNHSTEIKELDCVKSRSSHGAWRKKNSDKGKLHQKGIIVS